MVTVLAGLVPRPRRPRRACRRTGRSPRTPRPAWPAPTCPTRSRAAASWSRSQGWTATAWWSTTRSRCCGPAWTTPGAHWGVGVVCGAGINCVGVAPGRRDDPVSRARRDQRRLGRRRRASASEALWWAVRAEDGRGPDTELRAAVPAHFGLDRVGDVVIGLYRGKISHADLHGLVPVLFEVARPRRPGGDRRGAAPGRRDLRDGDGRGAAARAGRGGAGGARRQPDDRARPAAVAARSGQLILAELPGADARTVDVPPVAGAALLGLDHVGAPPAVAARLRESAAATW